VSGESGGSQDIQWYSLEKLSRTQALPLLQMQQQKETHIIAMLNSTEFILLKGMIVPYQNMMVSTTLNIVVMTEKIPLALVWNSSPLRLNAG